MAHITANGIRETTTTTGTGAIALSAVTGFSRFSTKCSTGDTVHASTVAVDGSGVPTGEWERGIYTYSAANELTRTVVLESSNAGAAVNFSAGTKIVDLTILAPNSSATTQQDWYRALGPDALTLFGMFGDGRDGNVTISSGTTTLTRDMFYNDLTISGTGSLVNAGYIIRVLGTLDISAAPASAITSLATAGGNGSGGAGGAQPAAPATGRSLALGVRGVGGVVGGTAAGTAGTAGTTASGIVLGGVGTATFGKGGSGGGGSGGVGGGGGSAANGSIALNVPTLGSLSTTNIGTANVGGASAGSGGGGGGDGTAGGGSGASGNGGGVIWVYARKINRSGSTATSAIIAKGGNGGSGASAAAGNRGGGGGGGGSGGGVVRVVYETLLGSTATNALDASPGNGGNGGNGFGTGTGGRGGGCCSGGVFEVCDIGNGTFTRTADTAGLAEGLNSGTTGGTGASKTWRVSL
jgi:hypothetical protein